MKIYCKVENFIHNKTLYMQCYTTYKRIYSTLLENTHNEPTYNKLFRLGIITYMNNKIIFDCSERRFLSLFVICI